MPKPTPSVARSDRRAADQADQAVTTTALCAAHRCRLCPGKIVSATPTHGQRCACPCHETP